MCGRYTLRDVSRAAREVLRLVWGGDLEPRFNVAPSQVVPVGLRTAEAVGIETMGWGFVPRYARDEKTPMVIKNTRIETGMAKPVFRKNFEQHRCLILGDGFYEWKRVGTAKQPYFIRLNGDRPFGFAGIWEPAAEGFAAGFSIVTTTPNELMAAIHDRMPVILGQDTAAAWLEARSLAPAELAAFSRPYPADNMAAYPVSSYVNNWRSAGPRCIEPFQLTEGSSK